MNPVSRVLGALAARFSADTPTPNLKRLPAAPPPRGDGVIQDTKQSEAAGMVTDVAMDRFATAITRISDPDDVLKRLGMRRHDLRRLEFDDEISGALETRREAAICSEWKIETDEDTLSDEAQFVDGQLRKVFVQMMGGCWDAIPYGYSVTEAIYRQEADGRLGIARMSVKPMQWFEPLRDGRLVLTRPGDGQRTDLDTRFKFCLMTRNATYANPLGEALLSRLYWPWFFRHAGWKAWMQFVDRFGDPFVVSKSGQPAELVEALIGMGIKNVIGVGTDDEINVLMQSGDETFSRLDARLTERILKMILGQTLTSGTDGKGSYALGKVHDAVRDDKRKSDTRMLQGAGQWVVNALWAINRFGGDVPRFKFDDPVPVDLERAKRDAGFKTAGVATFTKDYLMRAHGYKADEVDVPDPATVPPGGGNPLNQTQGDDEFLMQLAAGERGWQTFTPAQMRVEALALSAMRKAPVSPLSIKDMRAVILASKDREDLELRLAALIEKQSPQFAETLARALFAADVLGYLHADEGV